MLTNKVLVLLELSYLLIKPLHKDGNVPYFGGADLKYDSPVLVVQVF